MAEADRVYMLRNVVKSRTKGGVTFTLEIPELTIFQGEFIAVVGPSGCGKSTLLDMLALVLQPTSAEIFTIALPLGHKRQSLDVMGIADREISRIRARHIGYVLQNGGLLPFLTVMENIMLPLFINDMDKDRGRSRFYELIERLGLGDQISKKPGHLSGGQRQRVAVARALIHEPSIILADEPTAAVDHPTALEIMAELRELAGRLNSTVIMVSHDRDLVDSISHRQVTFDIKKVDELNSLATVQIRGT